MNIQGGPAKKQNYGRGGQRNVPFPPPPPQELKWNSPWQIQQSVLSIRCCLHSKGIVLADISTSASSDVGDMQFIAPTHYAMKQVVTLLLEDKSTSSHSARWGGGRGCSPIEKVYGEAMRKRPPFLRPADIGMTPFSDTYRIDPQFWTLIFD